MQSQLHIEVSWNQGVALFIIHGFFVYKPTNYWGTPIFGKPHMIISKLSRKITIPRNCIFYTIYCCYYWVSFMPAVPLLTIGSWIEDDQCRMTAWGLVIWKHQASKIAVQARHKLILKGQKSGLHTSAKALKPFNKAIFHATSTKNIQDGAAPSYKLVYTCLETPLTIVTSTINHRIQPLLYGNWTRHRLGTP